VEGLIGPDVGQMFVDKFSGTLARTRGLHRGFREY
jgi:hypothetical protein